MVLHAAGPLLVARFLLDYSRMISRGLSSRQARRASALVPCLVIGLLGITLYGEFRHVRGVEPQLEERQERVTNPYGVSGGLADGDHALQLPPVTGEALARVDSSGGRGNVAMLIAGLLLVLAAALATRRLVSRCVQEMEDLNRELEQRNARLEDQAAELESQADELQKQSSHLQETSAALEAANHELMVTNRSLVGRTAEAEEANRAKRDFLATMSHELRTPLNAIAGYAELMEMGLHGPVTEAQLTSLSRIRTNQNHLLSLVTDVLNLAKLESGRIEIRMGDVAVGELMTRVHELIEPQVIAKGLRYECEIPEAEIRLRGDWHRIEQILANLLGNAIKFTAPGGEVKLGCEADEERVRITVADTGCGIPADLMRTVFDPFVQLHGEASEREGGAGLGLSISRQLARRMGGDVTVESTPKRGSVFTLHLKRGYRTAEGDHEPFQPAIIRPEPSMAQRGS